MPARKTLIGPLSLVYIGPGPLLDEDLDEDVLKRIVARRSQGGFFEFNQPKTFVACRRSYEPSAPFTVTFSLTFKDAHDDVIKLARGIQIADDTDADDPPGSATYCILLIGPHRSTKRNYLIPRCQTVNPVTDNFQKKASYSQSIQFSMEGVDVNDPPYYRDTVAELVELMGDRSPL